MAKKNRDSAITNAQQATQLAAAAPQANAAELQQMMDSIERLKARTAARKLKTDLQDGQDEQALSEGVAGEVVSDSGAPLQMAQASIAAPLVDMASSAAAGSAVSVAATSSVGTLVGGLGAGAVVGGLLGLGTLALATGNSAQSDVDALSETITAQALALKAEIDALKAADALTADDIATLREDLDALTVKVNTNDAAQTAALNAAKAALSAATTAVADALAAEVTARVAGDATNAAAVADAAADLATLTAAVDTKDAAQTAALNAAKAALSAATTAVADALTAEIAARTSGDTLNANSIAALRTDLNTLTTAVDTKDAAQTAALNAAKAALSAATTAVADALAAEVTARVAGDATNAAAVAEAAADLATLTAAVDTKDAAQTAALNAAKAALSAATTAVADALAAEVTARVAGDATNAAAVAEAAADLATLTAAVDTKDAAQTAALNAAKAALSAATTVVADALAAEIIARTAGDALNAADIATLRTDLNTLTTAVDTKDAAQTAALNAAKDALNAAITALSDELHADIEALSNDMDAALALKASAADLTALKDRFDTARAELTALQTAAGNSDAALDALSDALDQAKLDFQTALDNLASDLRGEISDLEDDMGRALDDKADASELATLKGRFDTARGELDALKILADGTRTDLDALSDALDQAKLDFQTALDNLASDLRDEIAALSDEMDIALAGKASAAEFLELKGRFDTARGELDDLKTLADGTQADLETLQAAFDEATEGYDAAIAAILARLDALEAQPDVWEAPALELTTRQIFESEAGNVDSSAIRAGTLSKAVSGASADVDNLGLGEDNDAVIASVKVPGIAVAYKFDAGEDGMFESGDVITLSLNYGAGEDSLKTFTYTLSEDVSDMDRLGEMVRDQMNSEGFFESNGMFTDVSYSSEDGELILTDSGPLFTPAMTAEREVSLAELESGFTVPEGMIYTSVSDKLALLGELMNFISSDGEGPDDLTELAAEAFLTNWVNNQLVSAGNLVEVPDGSVLIDPLGEDDSFILVDDAGQEGLRQFVQAIELTNEAPLPPGALDALMDLLNADGSLTLNLSESFLDRIEGFDPATVTAHVSTAMTVAQATVLAEHGLDMANNVEFKIDDYFQNITSGTNNRNQVQILQNAQADKEDRFEDILPDKSSPFSFVSNPAPVFTFTGGADGLYDQGDVITLSWRGQDVSGEDADVVSLSLTVSARDGMTGDEVAEAFADMLSLDDGDFTGNVSDNTLTLSGDYDIWTDVKATVEDAANIIANGTEVGDEMQFGAPELGGVPLTILAGEGDDDIVAGYGRDVIVGQAGADEIVLTTRSRTGNYKDEFDTIVYETALDGAAYKEITFGGFDANESAYREGGVISVKINDTTVSYTITSQDVATFLTNDSSDDIDGRDHVLQQLAYKIASDDNLDIGEDQVDVIDGQGLLRIHTQGFGADAHEEWLEGHEAELRVSDQITVTFSSTDSDYYSDEHSDNFIQLVFTDSYGTEKTYTQAMIASQDKDKVTQFNVSNDSEVTFTFSADGSDDTFDRGDQVTLSFNVASQDHVFTVTLSEDMTTDELGQSFAYMISLDSDLGEDISVSYDDKTNTLTVTGDMPSAPMFGMSYTNGSGEDDYASAEFIVDEVTKAGTLLLGTMVGPDGGSDTVNFTLDAGTDPNFDNTFSLSFTEAGSGLSWVYQVPTSGKDVDVIGKDMVASADAVLNGAAGSDDDKYTITYDSSDNVFSIASINREGSGLFTSVSGEDATGIDNAYHLGDAEATVSALRAQLAGATAGVPGLGADYIVKSNGTSITIQATGDKYDDETFDFDVNEYSITVYSDDEILGVPYADGVAYDASADGLYSETTVNFTADDSDYSAGSTIKLTTAGDDGIAGNSDDLVFSYTLTSADMVGDYSINAITQLVAVINSTDDTGFDAEVSGDDIVLTRNTFGTESIDVIEEGTFVLGSSLDSPYEASLSWTESASTYVVGNKMTLSFTVFDPSTGSNGEFSYSYDLTSLDTNAELALANFATYLNTELSSDDLDITVSVDAVDKNVLNVEGAASGHPVLWKYAENGIFDQSGDEVGDSVSITDGKGANASGLAWWAESADVTEVGGKDVTLHFDYGSIDVFKDAHIGVQIGDEDFDVALKFTDQSSETVDWSATLTDLMNQINTASLDITATVDTVDGETLVLSGVQSFSDAEGFATNRTSFSSSTDIVVVNRVEQDLDMVSDDGTDGGLTLFETRTDTDHDEITGFQQEIDVIAFDGDLAARMGNRDDVDFEFVTTAYSATGSLDMDLDLDLTGVVLVSRTVNRATSSDVDVDDLTSAEDVASLLNDIFDFDAGLDGVLNTTVFSIVAADNKYESALWVHTQAHDEDDTVEAEELTLLATVCLAEADTFGSRVDVRDFYESDFAMTHLFPANVVYSVNNPG